MCGPVLSWSGLLAVHPLVLLTGAAQLAHPCEAQLIKQAGLELVPHKNVNLTQRGSACCLQGASTDADVEPLASGEARPMLTPGDLPPATELPSGSDTSSEASDSDAGGGTGGGGRTQPSGGGGGAPSGGAEAPEPGSESG